MSIAFWESKTKQGKDFVNPFQTNSDSRNDNSQNTCCNIPKIEILLNDSNSHPNQSLNQNMIDSTKPSHFIKPNNENVKPNKYERCADLKCKLAYTEEKIKELISKKEMIHKEISEIDKLLKSLQDKKSDILTKLNVTKCNS